MLLDAAALTLIVAFLAGGRLGRLRELDLRAPWIFVAAAALRVGMVLLGRASAPLGAGGLANIGVLLLVLVGLAANRHLWGMRLAAVGVLLNLLVIGANGGGMPVDRALAERAGDQRLLHLLDSPGYVLHQPITERTRLRPLADVLPLPLLAPRPRWFCPGSVGDVFITAGACWLLVSGLGAFGLRPGRAGPQAAAVGRADL